MESLTLTDWESETTVKPLAEHDIHTWCICNRGNMCFVVRDEDLNDWSSEKYIA